MRLRSALATPCLLVVLAAACHGSSSSSDVPQRSCSVTVWYQPASASSDVRVVGSWNGWASAGQAMTTVDGGWLATRFDDLPAGPFEYVIDVDGVWVTDANVATTAFHAGQEVTWVDVPDCGTPATQVQNVTAAADGTAGIDATFLATRWGDALDPSTVTLETVHGATPTTVTPSGQASAGTIHVDVAGLPPGKSTLAVHAKDVKGRDADAGLATVWTEAQTWNWQDAILYEVMVDRYRAADGSALAPPASMGGRAGGNVAGVQKAIESGELQSLGVNTIWLTPLYQNPEGTWPGLDGNQYTSYHGYWPSESRALETEMAAEADVDALVAAAHAKGIRILFDVVPHHVHQQHPYWTGNKAAGWFQDTSGTCICGVGSCSWAVDETACWFTSYLPSFDWTDDDVAATTTSDVRWWLDRFDGDGLRIDAVPMMPRAASRRIAWAARQEYDNPSHRTYILGENYTSQGGFPALRFDLGPQGLDGEFHFPLMWALRGALGDDSESLVDVDAAIHTGEETWAGSGAVMGLITDNHDVSRFSSVAALDDGGDTWTPAPQSTDPDVYARTQMALGAIMTLPGAPILYYGDEVALAGKGDPDSRRVMPADSALSALQTQTRTQVRTLGQARTCSVALRRGTYRTLFVDTERLVFAREVAGADTAIIDLQRNPSAPLSAPLPGIPAGPWVDVLSGRIQSLSPELTTLPAAPLSMALYVPASSPCAPGANP
ncbi:MAG: alpha-amylase family glycosyl hydrolase [Polyangiaceae bacterium]